MAYAVPPTGRLLMVGRIDAKMLQVMLRLSWAGHGREVLAHAGTSNARTVSMTSLLRSSRCPRMNLKPVSES